MSKREDLDELRDRLRGVLRSEMLTVQPRDAVRWLAALDEAVTREEVEAIGCSRDASNDEDMDPFAIEYGYIDAIENILALFPRKQQENTDARA